MVNLYFSEMKGAKFQSDKFSRKVLGKELNIDGNNLIICNDEFGKPYLKDFSGIFHNISHTDGAIVCALANKPVGVDIEKVKKLNKRIAERFFTPKERGHIFSDFKNQDERFAEIWTVNGHDKIAINGHENQATCIWKSR